jgi:hypothetical protein
MKLFGNRKNKIDDIQYMHSYEEFPKDAELAFSSIKEKYRLKFKANGIYSVDFTNKYCRINFNMDRYDLQALLFKKGDSTSFSITRLAIDVNELEYSKEVIPATGYGNKEGVKDSLFFYSRILDKYLNHILKGDLIWYDRIKQEDEYESKLIGVILGGEIEHKHPISKKFWDGDSSWKSDIEKYIKEKEIKI